MITNYFSSKAIIKRRVTTLPHTVTPEGGEPVNVPFSQTDGTVGVVYGHLQQASGELAEKMGFKLVNPYIFLCEKWSDIKISDTVEIGSDNYSVKGIMKANYGKNQHLQVTLEKTG